MESRNQLELDIQKFQRFRQEFYHFQTQTNIATNVLNNKVSDASGRMDAMEKHIKNHERTLMHLFNKNLNEGQEIFTAFASTQMEMLQQNVNNMKDNLTSAIKSKIQSVLTKFHEGVKAETRWIFLSNLGDRNEAAIPSLPSEQRKSRRVLDYVLARREEQNLHSDT